MLTNKKICFIGAGPMTEAIIAGMLNKQIVKPEAIHVTNRTNRRRLEELSRAYRVVAEADQKEQSIREADILILSMQPKDVAEAIEEIRTFTHSRQLIVSVIAGVKASFISQLLGHDAPIVRTMPNTSATIGQSATGICKGDHATEKDLAIVERIFEAIGVVTPVEEAQLDVVTGLAGSGPAYIYHMTNAMITGAMKAGLDRQMAKELTLQTIAGAVEMMKTTGEDPAVLRDQVITPNGTTEAGINTLRDYRFEEAVVSCILRATERAKELGAQLTGSKT